MGGLCCPLPCRGEGGGMGGSVVPCPVPKSSFYVLNYSSEFSDLCLSLIFS